MAAALPPTTPAVPKPIAGRITVGIAAATPTPATVPTAAQTAVFFQDIDGSFEGGSPFEGGSLNGGSFDGGSSFESGSFHGGSFDGGSSDSVSVGSLVL